ncbi:restriction endonuclease subunit S [Natranaerobius thermophilus]|uniref:Restriction modification system DNA specificity domain n=1 Tax=Natranaerobius thermophilus (strain ATCC BAA-1301 / DSM 18059 / JW/NM-WN-LF) TaxID=457570 RepID=B2A6M8_NATTJ|nr:restriction endonuclease subunit S [Natranaerobius thermophilus]ACB85558.1 restriction modification system DNA specificity domain [Natranaerobius thermophilus JW/NM-WN-LF]
MTDKKSKRIEELLEETIVHEDEEPYELPNNWAWVALDILAEEIKNGTTIKQSKTKPGIPVTRIESIQNNEIQLDRVRYIRDLDKIKNNDYYKIGDIVLSHINSIEHVGKTALIKEDYLPLIHGMNLLRIRVNNNMILPQFLQLYTRSYNFRKAVLKRIKMAVNQVSLNQKNLKQISIPIAPKNEQRRIVYKVDRLLSKINKAKELIGEAKETFELRRAAILDKAFKGELTWREENPRVESVDTLLAKINSEKKTDIKKSPNGLYELPDNWCWIDLGELICHSSYGTSAKAYKDINGLPVLRMGNIKLTGSIDLNDLKYLPFDHKDVEKYKLEEYDLLFNRTNSYELVGKSAIVEPEHAGKFTYASYLIKISLFYKKILAPYICYYINSHIGRKYLLSTVKQQVGQANINSKKLSSLPVPLPPEEEIKEINRIMKKVSAKENRIQNLLNLGTYVAELEQSILSKAFRGELNTNDPKDESAIELLKEVLKDK